jgi:hypothetical protein
MITRPPIWLGLTSIYTNTTTRKHFFNNFIYTPIFRASFFSAVLCTLFGGILFGEIGSIITPVEKRIIVFLSKNTIILFCCRIQICY